MKLYVSTGALCTRKNGRDWRVIPPAAENLDCDGLEFMMYDSWYDRWETVVRDLLGLNFPTMHVEKCLGEKLTADTPESLALAREEFEINCEMARRLGAKLLVLHLWNGLPSDGNFAANLRAYPALRETAEKFGLLLTVENIVCRFGDPLAHFRELRAAWGDVAFTFDVKLAQFHGQTESAFSPEHAWMWNGPVRHVHVSDFAGETMDWSALRSLHPGQGRVNFPGFFDHLKRVGYDGGVTIESTSVEEDGRVNFPRLSESLKLLRGWMG